MTRKQRAQVVELLRCAADLLLNHGSMFPRLDAVKYLGADEYVDHTAYIICIALDMTRNEDPLLEAAARVEEGSWP